MPLYGCSAPSKCSQHGMTSVHRVRTVSLCVATNQREKYGQNTSLLGIMDKVQADGRREIMAGKRQDQKEAMRQEILLRPEWCGACWVVSGLVSDYCSWTNVMTILNLFGGQCGYGFDDWRSLDPASRCHAPCTAVVQLIEGRQTCAARRAGAQAMLPFRIPLNLLQGGYPRCCVE